MSEAAIDFFKKMTYNDRALTGVENAEVLANEYSVIFLTFFFIIFCYSNSASRDLQLYWYCNQGKYLDAVKRLLMGGNYIPIFGMLGCSFLLINSGKLWLFIVRDHSPMWWRDDLHTSYWAQKDINYVDNRILWFSILVLAIAAIYMLLYVVVSFLNV